MPSNKKHLFPVDHNVLTQIPRCPVCGAPADFGGRMHAGQQQILGWCDACTNVWITSDAADAVRRQNKRYLLSTYLRKLPAEEWDTEVGLIAINELERLITTVPELTVLDQFDLALKLICEMCPVPGQPSTFNYQTDWPLLTARDSGTAIYILNELADGGYLHKVRDAPPIPPIPTWKAYERLQQIQSSGRNSDIGFVAMSFSPEQLGVWKQVIEPGIIDAGYRPIRVDQYEHNHRIDDEIIAQIKRCRFLVADFTEQKYGVYFEAGFALGLGRNIIWMCNHSEHDKLHFDTRQFNHILYEDAEKAKRALTNRIVALEGPGTYIAEIGK